MSDYRVRFIGGIVENKRPDGFPQEIFYDVFVRQTPEGDEVRTVTNNEAGTIAKYQGMTVLVDPNAMQEPSKKKYDVKIFVPLHMITHIRTETTMLVSDVPDVGDEGVKLQ